MSKSDLRRQYLLIRRNLTPTQVQQWSQQIQTRFLGRDEFLKASCIALYSPIQHEVETQAILTSARQRQLDICLPQWDPSTAAIRFYSIQSGRQLHQTAWGTREPIPRAENERDLEELDLIVVPGVVFDRDGYRLGYGYGGYDRILEHYQGTTIGLAYNIQSVDTLPREAHDVPCTLVITESGAL